MKNFILASVSMAALAVAGQALAQTGNLSDVTQSGNGSSVIVQQLSDRNTSNVNQTGGATAEVTQKGGVNTLGSRSWDGNDLPPPNNAGPSYANNVSLVDQTAAGASATLTQDGILNPDHIADSYWMLHTQPRDAWTHELDLRPYMEKF